ncbi:hypothetical protein BDV93DRAFT_523410 [Ceratobasidium sp. AG-I]|nr:hypothetical protein BDV93DRAFT_523410 [Ceratobasidium sp. AG-I]
MVSTRWFIALTGASVGVSSVLGVPVYGQCGGIGYTGSGVCDAPAICAFYNIYESQCLPPQTLDQYMKWALKKYFGAGVDSRILSANAGLLKEFGAITPNASIKWDAIEPTRNSFVFSQTDLLVNFAQANGKLVRGSPLVWHSQLPSWVKTITDAPTLTSVIQNHVSVIVGRYKGKVYAWDVVNEILNEDGTFRNSVFYSVLGTNFVPIAFKAARAADPAAKLYISDYNLDSDNDKVKALVKFVNAEVAAGTPIDGIGSQAHLPAGGSSGVPAALTALAATKRDLAITELDIQGGSVAEYKNVIKACVSATQCVGVSVYGSAYNEAWIPSV